MYKRQMTAQKIVCFLMLAVAALMFIAAIGMSTDLYEILYPCVSEQLGKEFGMSGPYEFVTGASVYLNIQPFNKLAVRLCLGLIVISLLSFIAQSHVRRKYYIFNYITTAVVTVAFIGVAAYILIGVIGWKNTFLTTVDFDSAAETSLKSYAASPEGIAFGVKYDKSTGWLDFNIIACIITVISSVLYALNTVWKFILERNEEKLLAQSALVAPAGEGEVA